MSRVMAEPEYPDLADTIERTHRSVEAFVAGDPDPNKRLNPRTVIEDYFAQSVSGWGLANE
jgi:hypothetical protein